MGLSTAQHSSKATLPSPGPVLTVTTRAEMNGTELKAHLSYNHLIRLEGNHVSSPTVLASRIPCVLENTVCPGRTHRRAESQTAARLV